MSIGLIIVAYNDAHTLESCVRSIVATGFQGAITIVDNASTDETASVGSGIAATTESVTLVSSAENLGYAGGFNLGCRSLKDPYIAVMGADCRLDGDWMTVCADLLDDQPSIAACSPTVALSDGSGLNAEGLTLHKAGFGFNRHLGEPLGQAATGAERVDGIQGSAFAIRRTALDAIGGWSEAGFLYHEDVELSWAVAAAGYEVWHVPTPPIQHDYHLTMSPEKFFLLERNRVEMVNAYLGIWMRLALTPVFLATELAVWAYAASKRSGLASAKWRSYKSVWQRRTATHARRAEIKAFRTISERALIARMPLAYPRNQTRTLRSQAPSQGRRGGRDLPTG